MGMLIVGVLVGAIMGFWLRFWLFVAAVSVEPAQEPVIYRFEDYKRGTRA